MATTTTPAAPAPKQTVALYDLAAALHEVNQWAQEEAAANDGELPGWLEELQLEAEEALEKKVERIGKFIRRQEGLEKAVRAEVAVLQGRAQRFERRIKRVKEYVRVLLGTHGLKKIETATVTVSRSGNGGKRPVTLLVPVDELALHPETARFVRETKTLEADTDALRAYLEAEGADELCVKIEGEEAPHALVRLEPRGEHARIS